MHRHHSCMSWEKRWSFVHPRVCQGNYILEPSHGTHGIRATSTRGRGWLHVVALSFYPNHLTQPLTTTIFRFARAVSVGVGRKLNTVLRALIMLSMESWAMMFNSYCSNQKVDSKMEVGVGSILWYYLLELTATNQSSKE
jgi:hypothetical protein